MKFADNVVALFLCRALSSSFFKSLYILRDSNVSVVRERNFLHMPKGVHCSCRNESDCLYELDQSFVLLPVVSTFTIDFDQFELQRSLIRINFLPRSSELQVLGIWRRSSKLLVFRIFGTWSSESSSPQKLETFIRTSCFRIFNLLSGQTI